MELKKGQTMMMDVNLQLPASILHEAVTKRSGLPADTFELYYRSKRLEGEAVLASWGVEKNSLIELKARGRGGMDGGGGGGCGGGGADVGSGVGGVGGVGGGSSSGVGGGGVGSGGAGGIGSDSGVGGAGGGSSAEAWTVGVAQVQACIGLQPPVQRAAGR